MARINQANGVTVGVAATVEHQLGKVIKVRLFLNRRSFGLCLEANLRFSTWLSADSGSSLQNAGRVSAAERAGAERIVKLVRATC